MDQRTSSGHDVPPADEMLDPAAIAARYAGVLERIKDAARRSGRDPATVTLVVVTKAFGLVAVRAALAAGTQDLGENYVQEAARKIEALGTGARTQGDRELRWHFIGQLQQNKAARAARLFDVIHTVDSAALARRIDRVGTQLSRVVRVLVEVNISGEPSKAGIPRPAAGDLLRALKPLEHVRVEGLMTIPPPGRQPDASRPYFRSLAALRNELASRGFDLPHLSMGMTDDYEVAIEEGATIVRLGRAIFGERPRRTGV